MVNGSIAKAAALAPGKVALSALIRPRAATGVAGRGVSPSPVAAASRTVVRSAEPVMAAAAAVPVAVASAPTVAAPTAMVSAARPTSVAPTATAAAARPAATATASATRPAMTTARAAAEHAKPTATIPAEPMTEHHAGLYELSHKLQEQVLKLEAKVMTLEEDRDALRQENEVIGEHVYSLQKENGLLHDMGMNSFLEKAELAKQAEGHGSEVSQMRLALQQHGEKLLSFSAENSRMRAVIEALQGERAQLRLSITGLETNLESVKVDLVRRVNTESLLEQTRVTLERELQDLRVAKHHVDQVVTGQHIEIARNQEVLAELNTERGRNYDLAQKLQTADMEIQRCYKEKAELDQIVSTLHVECAHLKTQRDSALTEVPNLSGALRQQGTLVADLEAQVHHLQQGVIELQRHNTKLDQDSKGYSFQLEKTRHQAGQLEKAVGALQGDNIRLRNALEMQGAGRAEVDARLHSTVTEKGLMQSHMEQARAQREHLQLHAQQHSAENAALKSRIIGLEKVVQGYQDEASNLQERVRLLREEKEELQKVGSYPQPSRVSLSAYAQGVQGVAL
mmetsp:Transcript_99787/g.280579  ORF Transcript_99787/g.280579 Transcript_99787/m.280579 type:complete len:568 (+) Transcript_99787:108-1811(+)